MVSVVVGDEFFVSSFMYGGFDRGLIVRDMNKSMEKIDEALSIDDVKVIVVSKEVYKQNSKYIDSIKADASKPMIAEV